MATYAQVDPRILQEEDERQLRYLTIANYVWAGFSAFGVLVGACVLLFISGVITFNSSTIDPEALAVLGFVGGTAGFLVVLLPLISTVLHFAFARALQIHRFHKFCIVMAIWTCLSVPIGTVIGILTLIVLLRPSVEHLFSQRQREIDETTIAASGGHPNHGVA